MFTDATLAAELKPFGQEMVAPTDALLFDCGERADGIYIVVSGEVLVAVFNDEGNEIWTRTVGQDGIVGLPAAVTNSSHCCRAVARQHATLAFVPAQKLSKLIRDNPQIGSTVLRCLSEEVREARRKISTLGVRPSPWLN